MGKHAAPVVSFGEPSESRAAMIVPRSVSYQLCRKSYQFRHMLRHVNMKPPNIMPEKMASKPLPDNQNQAPIIPPVAMLASNQKIQVGRLFIGDAVRPRAGYWRLKPVQKLHDR